MECQIILKLLPICLVIFLWILVLNIGFFQTHLRNNYNEIWRDVTFRHWFFISRENYTFTPFNHKGLKLLLFKAKFNDRVLMRLRNRIRVVIAICLIMVIILLNL